MKITERLHSNNPWVILIIVAIGLFMVVVDVTIINIALPEITIELNASLAALEWTLIAYALALNVLVPIFGRISDVLGRKRLFLIGLFIFASGSLLAGFSQSILWLIGARIFQAFGGALITTNVLAIITDAFPEGKRGTAMGVQAIIVSGGAAIGPTLGGVLVTHFGWQSVFLVNVPVGLIAILVAIFFLPPFKSNRTLEPVDWTGASLLIGGVTPLLLGVTKAPDWGWASPLVLSLIAGGLLVIVLFVIQQQHARFPLVDLSLFRIRQFSSGLTAGVFATIALATLALLFPFYWQGLRGYSAQTAGLLMMPLPFALMFSAPISGRLSDTLGARGIASTGLAVLMLGLFLISQVTATMPILQVAWRLVVFGIGLGMFSAPNNNSVMSAVPATKRGISSGLLGMSRYTGQCFGIAFGATIFVTFATAAGGFALHSLPTSADIAAAASDPAAQQAMSDAFIHGMRAAALCAIPLAGIGALLSMIRGNHDEELATGSMAQVQLAAREDDRKSSL